MTKNYLILKNNKRSFKILKRNNALKSLNYLIVYLKKIVY